MDREQYNQCKDYILKHRKASPDTWNNEPTALEFFAELHKEYPESSIHLVQGYQFICLNDKARTKLAKNLTQLIKKHEREIKELKNAIDEIERRITL
jgi:adenosyl cobinamide kinase/adenosyl cobinamide phosphate guanylyltransferase